MSFKLFLILYVFLKDALKNRAPPKGEAWSRLEADLAEESEEFRQYLADRE